MCIEKPTYHLLQNERFYANFLLGCKITYNDKKVERAAVSVNRGEICFYFNTDYFTSLKLKEQMAIIKHEIFHVLLEHCTIRSGDRINKEAKNIAMDCAINQMIEDLPEGCVTLDFVNKVCKKTLLPMQNWEYYYNNMFQAAEEQFKNGNSQHDHDKMEEGDEKGGIPMDIQRATIRDAANKAAKASAGNMPDAIAKILGDLNKGAEINWKQQLRNLVGKARSVQIRSTITKSHRRFELDQPGKKKKRTLVVGVPADSSGSVSDEQYSAFLNEIKFIAKTTSITYLVHADCVVQKVDVIKGGKAKGEVLKARHGGGGTAYQPAIDKCMELKCDIIIYFGDGDSADIPTDPKIPFVWVMTSGRNPPANFGSVVRLSV